jgi:Mrp family chromosome partitioning ATPase
MSPKAQKILQALRALADYIILDSSPVLAVTDARLLASKADATLIVVEERKTRSKAFTTAAQLLTQADAKIIGVVLNKSRSRRGRYDSPTVTARATRTWRASPLPSGCAAPDTLYRFRNGALLNL